MKYSRKDLLQLPDNHLSFDESIEFVEDTYQQFPRIRKLKDVQTKGEGIYDPASQHLDLHIHVEGIMTCPCDITFEDVDIPFSSDADETISFNKNDSEDVEILIAEGDSIDLMPLIFRQILLEVPIKVKKEGEIEYPKGEGWEVVDEATYQKEKDNQINPQMAALRDYVPQDEEEV